MDLKTVIEGRRSIRKYKDNPVEPEKIQNILDAARLAPSWKNMQCWRFIVVEDTEVKDKALEAFNDDNPGKKGIAMAPVLIVVCADPKDSGIEDGKEFYLADAAIAFEHIMLAAFSEGLGTCWMGLLDETKLKEALDIPEAIKVIGVTPLGYPDQDPKPRPRKSLEEIVFKNKWGN